MLLHKPTISYPSNKSSTENEKITKHYVSRTTSKRQFILPNCLKSVPPFTLLPKDVMPLVDKLNKRLYNQEKQLERFPIPTTIRPVISKTYSVKNKAGRTFSKKHIATLSVLSSRNNTLLTLSGGGGRVLKSGWASAGSVGFKNSRKSSTYASQAAAKSLLLRAKQQGIRALHIKLLGTGRAEGAVVRTLQQSSLKIWAIKECTSAVHNGCRRPKIRRI